MTTQQTWYVSGAGRFVYARDETIPVARVCSGPNMGARGKLIAAAPDMLCILKQAIDESGFSIAGPTDHRVAEHGEPHWVCNARALIAKIDGAS